MAFGRPVNTWPLVLCGPMLRRVTRASVAVFVATSQKCRVAIEEYRGTSTSTKCTLLASFGTDTRALGDRLHVAVVDITGLALAPGTLYGYDVRLTPEGGADRYLADLGLLAPPLSLGYDLKLPTFSVPENLSELVITYGSCRKAHGEGHDAFPLLDRMIERDRLSPRRRPHLLILGGDQIYADDVPVPLLTLIREVGTDLMGPGYTETLTPATGTAYSFADAAIGAGPERARFTNTAVGYTAGLENAELTDAHLLFRAEYYGIYLFQWSDALWPDHLGLAADHFSALGTVPDSYRTKIEQQSFRLDAFRRAVPQARRALANVPTLMIFDDHDVTDDWNLHREWVTRVRTTGVTRQVTRNALAAYTVFQAWGNEPAAYRGAALPYTVGQRVLEALATDQNPVPIPEADLDAAFDIAAATTAPNARLRFDWEHLDADAGFRVIALDTRTARGFAPAPASARSHAALVASDPALDDAQLAAANGPALGRQLLARGLQPNLLTFVVSAAPVLGHPLVELVTADVLLKGATAAEAFDAESWGGNRAAFEDLLRRLASFGRVVLLSGDVHYGFSVEGAWFDTPAVGAARPARLVQLCSSAMRNEDDKTRAAGRAGWGAGVDALPELGWFGFRGDQRASRAVLPTNVAYFRSPSLRHFTEQNIIERLAAPAVLPDRHYTATGLAEIQRLIGAAPGSTGRTDWRYVLRYLSDDRTPEQRLTDAGLDPTILANNQHLRETLLDTAVVGVNNVGRVTITVTNGAPTLLTHELHWWLDLATTSAPVAMKTVHRATLQMPAAADLPTPQP